MELNPNILKILNGRGYLEEEEIEEFLSNKPKKTYDPFLLHDMEAGVDFILSAVDNGENICIYGDYDADGVTSVTILKDVLAELGAEPSYYIPSRMDEGYGLNDSALDKIKDAGADLVITVDCGCTSVKEVEHAKEIGLKIMITDHHKMKDEIPDCILINPKHPDSSYPFRELAGAGVAFKLAQALVETAGLSKDILTRNLDMVSIGTIGDMVPLVDENRMLTKYGLRTINLSERTGLKALIDKTGLKKGSIDSRNVSFVLSPHINAAGRMDNATLAARLMQTVDSEKAEILAEELAQCNQNRKNVQQNLLSDCMDEAENQILRGNKCIFVEFRDAHEGVIGIVASQLKERFGLPALVLTDGDDGNKKGSGRSPDGVDIFSVLNRHPELFVRFGGHAAACGFTVKKEAVLELNRIVNEEMLEIFSGSPEGFSPNKEPEIILDGADVTSEFIREQSLMEPFGKGNPRPLIGVKIQKPIWERMGVKGQYLRLSGTLSDGRQLKCVDFRKADANEESLRRKAGMDGEFLAVGYLEEREWNGKTYIQMELEYLE